MLSDRERLEPCRQSKHNDASLTMIRSPTSQWLLLITHHIAAIVRLYRCITMGGATRGEVWQYNVHPLLEPAAYMGDMFVSFQSGDIN